MSYCQFKSNQQTNLLYRIEKQLGLANYLKVFSHPIMYARPIFYCNVSALLRTLLGSYLDTNNSNIIIK